MFSVSSLRSVLDRNRRRGQQKKFVKTNAVKKSCEIMKSGPAGDSQVQQRAEITAMEFSYESDDFEFEDNEDVKPDVTSLQSPAETESSPRENEVNRRRKQKKPKRGQKSTSMSVGIHRIEKRLGLRNLGSEIRQQENYAKSKLCIHRRPFQRLVRQISYEFKENLRFQSSAIDALREATEHYLVELFEKSSWCAAHGKRVTIQPKDMLLVLKITQDPYLFASTDKE